MRRSSRKCVETRAANARRGPGRCSTKWAVFLLSLKSLLETEKGAPAPNEIKLDRWE
jgi:hypothetical protein